MMNERKIGTTVRKREIRTTRSLFLGLAFPLVLKAFLALKALFISVQQQKVEKDIFYNLIGYHIQMQLLLITIFLRELRHAVVTTCAAPS